MANRLQYEDSPYLQQHSLNPLDWFAWGDEAFEKAKKEKKPIFLSIGYSSCHWCHVMEEEVFENESIAKLTNEVFISIKVDKEERPDLDKYYQNVYSILNGRAGGWPLSIFLTHNLKPFYTATYIPPESFTQIVEYFKNEYQNNYKELEDKSKQIDKFSSMVYNPSEVFDFKDDFLQIYSKSVLSDYDRFYGGYSKAPKFPRTAIINNCFLLDEKCINSALNSLKWMAKGGFYDLVDGGFCRYSVDDIWLVPHFEKMTYDNGLLSENYLNAYLYTKDDIYLNIAKDTIDFMLEKMSEKNLFYSASDADSKTDTDEKEEGFYFTYTYDELENILDNKTIQKLNISKDGNFEGRNIIRDEELHGIDKDIIKKLKDLRTTKSYPFIDNKVITSWNSMMIKSLFLLAKVDNSYLNTAISYLDTLLDTMYLDDTLYHSKLISSKDKPSIKAFLEDYAYLIDTLLEAYQNTFKDKYLSLAKTLIDKALELYYKEGRWYFSNEEFITEADIFDTSYPSSIGIMINSLLTLASFKDISYMKIVNETLRFYSSMIERSPSNFSSVSKAIIRMLQDETIIKSKKENLIKIRQKLPQAKLYNNGEDSIYVCGLKSCFNIYDELDSFFKAI